MYITIADLPVTHHANRPVVHHEKHLAGNKGEVFYATHQATGRFRFVELTGVQPRLQQQFLNRNTGALTWQTVPFVHKNKENDL